MTTFKLRERLSRWVRNPTLQFLVGTFILAPIIGIFGAALGHHYGHSCWGLTGAFLALSMVTFAGLRSYRYERALLPPENVFTQITGRNSLAVKYLIQVATICIFSAAGAVATAVLAFLCWAASPD